ncbi:MAG: hypothetical protein E6G90_18865 [Alphaproteobacteria bacterium]|nr:MAG: hypothetical protein E6G90_18865 [Alphaproteobacteria bacterium]
MRIVRKSKGSGNADVTQTVQQMTQKMLGKQLYVVHTTPVAPREQIMALLPANLEHQIKLEKAGIMFGARPVVSEDGSAAGGLIVIRAASFEAAKKIADSDPLHKAGPRSYRIRQWTVNEGCYSRRINYSDQSVTIE